MNRFENQVAIVTGGAQGIGLGIARRLGSEGARVVLFDIKAERLRQAVGELEGADISTHAVPVDVTDETPVNAAVAEVREKFGRIDVLVTAAGVAGLTNRKTHEVDVGDFRHVMEINVTGMFLCCRAVLPVMLQANYGRIVNIASISGKEGNAGMLAYSTSKAAVIGLTKVMGKEYAETGITVNALAPAVVRTQMVDELPPEQVKYMTDRIPMKRTGEIEEIAALAAYTASPEAGFTTAFTFDATGGRATY
ncbi:SDR family NAD(P)-dependent oxidoreductase [Candidatus Thiosymbion oneisti]|uniref:SDR family NAD(P)-dependent oxidoreductase n=1 Tax=Candidatus Thiosymbion oneisti TaxID=589554 RepID=UPI000AD6C5FB|nr:SDR family NAD(P)-dependent oxidoreductase [Candidatus Thiosymbion oneisti]